MAVGFVPLPDGTGVIVSGDEAGRIRRWDAANGDPIGESIVGHASKVHIIEALPAAGTPLFASSDQEGVLRRWDAVTGAPAGTPIVTGTDVYALATPSVGGTGLLLAAGADENVRAWEADSGDPIDLSIRSTVVSALTRPDGMALLAASTAQGDIVIHKCSFHAE
jgi:WD40 repeat protein